MIDTLSENATIRIHHTSGVDDFELARRRLADLNARIVGGAHWFRSADCWCRLNFGYLNPLNIHTPHSELFLLSTAKSDLMPFVSGHNLHFFGVGVGDTEILLVDYLLSEDGRACGSFVDVNPVFLRMFESSLRNLSAQTPRGELEFEAKRTLFEMLQQEDFATQRGERPNLLACLGNTIGNYENADEIFDVFRRCTSAGDRLLLTYQLPTYLALCFDRYTHEPWYRDLVGNFLTVAERQEIHFRLNLDRNRVEAWFRETNLFRSSRYLPEETAFFADAFGFTEKLRRVDIHQNLCLHVFERR